jgi:hypothetical protein
MESTSTKRVPSRPGNCRPLLVALLFAVASLPSLGEVYKYVDRYGRTTYTDRPDNPHYVKVDLKPKGWTDPTSSARNLAFARKNMDKYRQSVAKVSEEYGLPEPLLHAVITVESAYDPWAVSPAGAMGLMQLMPGTAKRYGVSNSFDPEENIRGGSKYLKYLMSLFKNDLNLVLAAYNAGEGAVQKYGNAIPPYTETQNYVRKVREHYRLLNLQRVSMN